MFTLRKNGSFVNSSLKCSSKALLWKPLFGNVIFVYVHRWKLMIIRIMRRHMALLRRRASVWLKQRLRVNSSYWHTDSVLSRDSFRHEGTDGIFICIWFVHSVNTRACIHKCICVCVSRMHEEDPVEAVRVCESLLDEKDLDPAVRVGDVYGFLVEHYCNHGNFQQVCWGLLLEGFHTGHVCSGPNPSAIVPGAPATLVSDLLDSVEHVKRAW